MPNSFATPWTVACQTPLSIGFPRQEYWSGLPFPSPGDLCNPGVEPASPELAGRLFTTEPPGRSISLCSLTCDRRFWKKVICTDFFIYWYSKKSETPLSLNVKVPVQWLNYEIGANKQLFIWNKRVLTRLLPV